MGDRTIRLPKTDRDLTVRFLDAGGVHVETYTGPAREAIQKAVVFLLLHGCDPEEGGRDAMSGTIEFDPA